MKADTNVDFLEVVVVLRVLLLKILLEVDFEGFLLSWQSFTIVEHHCL
jgi:hypothetical protein